MKTIPQYVTKDGRRFYYSLNPILCCKCETHINDFVVIILEWSKKKSEVLELCFKCAKTHKQTGDLQEKFIMCVTNKKPLGSNFALISPPELMNSKKDDSLFCNTLDAPHINNKAKRSGHPDYTFLDDKAPVVIGLPFDAEKDERVLLLDKDEDIKKLLE